MKRLSASNDFIRDLAPLVIVPEKSQSKSKPQTSSSSSEFESESEPPKTDGEEQAAAIAAEAANLNAPRSEEQHFITMLVAGRGLVTEAAVQVGNRWVTPRELEEESAAAREVTAAELREVAFRAEREKLAGKREREEPSSEEEEEAEVEAEPEEEDEEEGDGE